LQQAGVSRSLFFEENDKRRPTGVHDLRGLFVTTALANGRTESWVADRTGHKSSQMINRYNRRKRRHEESNLGTLVALDVAISGARSVGPAVGPDRR
jgi:integrase